MKRRFRSKTRTRRYKKRNYRRSMKRKRYGNRSRVMAPAFVFPNKLYTKLKFEEYGNFIHNDNTAPTYIDYRGTQPHKPNASGTGTCTGYSQFENSYRRCTVIGSKIQVFFTDTNTTLVTNIPAVILNPELDTTDHLDLNEFRNINEVKYGKLRIIEPSSSSPFTRTTLKGYMSTKTMFNVSKKEIKDNFDDYGIDVGDTLPPTKAWRWSMYVACPWNAVDVTAQLHYRVLITYYCMFSDPILTPII